MKVNSIKLRRRRAFTLLELLIVVGIIALLMSMSVVVMLGFLDQAEEEATNATIQKINKILEQRTEAFDRAFVGARRNTAITLMKVQLQDPNGDGDRSDGVFGVKDAVVEILAKKWAYRYEFPQRFEERLLLDPAASVPGLPQSMYLAILAPAIRAELGIADTVPLTDPSIVTPAIARFGNRETAGITDSSELLYFSLLKSTNFGSAAVDDDRFSAVEIQDTDNDGLPEFVDAWGQPLRYYRWPTRLIDTDPPVPFQPNFADLNDPTDIAIDTNGDGAIDTGVRRITSLERQVANMLLKGLPPAPFMLPNNAMPRDALLTDPDDPVGRLYAELEYLDGTNGKPLLAAEFNETKYHTPDTFHAPLVVSAGIDGRLGLYEPTDTANKGHLAAYNMTLGFDQIMEDVSDNISSRNKVSGGRQ
ncbi:MAG: type II secretion system protein [Planctomycetota bacterium]